MKNVEFTKDEELIKEALIEARKIQEYIWQELSMLKKPYDPLQWAIVFQKRVDKIYDLKLNNTSNKIELRKRVLQQAALSILALRVLDESI